MVHNEDDNKDINKDEEQEASTAQQEQSDPQLTELRGLTDPSEDLEPTLTDGTKSPDKD